MASLTKPLEGIRVLDLSHVLAMPYATMVLGDLGAEIIKVERPGAGDDSRRFGPYKNGESAYFMSINRNKLSITLNLKLDEGKEILRKLIKVSDVLAESFRPETMEKLGLSYEEIKRLNPKIIYASISGFGHDSLYPKRLCYDIIAQAFAGLMSITGYPETPPTRVGSSIADIMTGLFTSVGILAALRTRETTGEGQRIDMAMVDCVIAALENAIVRFTVSGEVPTRMGSRHPSLTPFDVFRTSDGYVVIAIGNDQLWERFCKGIPEFNALLNDDRFKTNDSRTEHQEAIKQLIESWSGKLTTDEVVALCSTTMVPCSPVNTIDKVVNDPNTSHRKMIAQFDHSVAGKIRTANNPVSFSLTPCKNHRPAPLLGEHTEKVLAELLGYSNHDIGEFRRKGVI